MHKSGNGMTIRKLSRHTKVIDCAKVVRAYLKSIGHQGCTIGEAEVYAVKVKARHKTVAAFGSRQEAEAFAAAHTPHPLTRPAP